MEYAREMGNRAEAVGLDRHPIHPRDWRFTRATGCSVPNSLFWRIVCAPGCKRARAGTGPVCCEWVTDRRSTPRDAATPDLDDPRAGPHTIYLLRVRARSSPFDALRRSACACAAFPRSAFAVRRSTRSGARLAPAPRFRAQLSPFAVRRAPALGSHLRLASARGLRPPSFSLQRLAFPPSRSACWFAAPQRSACAAAHLCSALAWGASACGLCVRRASATASGVTGVALQCRLSGPSRAASGYPAAASPGRFPGGNTPRGPQAHTPPHDASWLPRRSCFPRAPHPLATLRSSDPGRQSRGPNGCG